MKNNINILMLFVICGALVLSVTTRAEAQVPAPEIISINSPISEDLRGALDAWLWNSPPSVASYYAVTYTQASGNGTYVSMVALDLSSPDEEWHFTGKEVEDEDGNKQVINQVIWFDTVFVDEFGTVSFPFAENENASTPFKMAMPDPGAGGGSYVRFPWQPSKAVQWGLLGVYHPLYGTDDSWRAIDLISGSDMGSGAANDQVYASVAGEITYLCSYGNSVAVKISGNGDSFLYANLVDNANLEMGHSFAAGSVIGRLVHGAFVDECGYAAQQDNHWQLRWGFVIGGNKFQAEGCTLIDEDYTGPKKWEWRCGNTITKPLGFLYHYGNLGVSSGDPNDPYFMGNGGGPSFWDFLIGGMSDLLDALLISKLPKHNSINNVFIYALQNGVKIVFRILQVLIKGNLNLIPAATVIGIAIGVKLALRSIVVIGYIIRIIKSIPLA